MPIIKQTRNLSMECCKLIASFFVVFIHVPFPGTFGQFIGCLGRIAVPIFFAISGFFSYQASSAKIAKRFIYILKLNLIATLLHIVWECFLVEYDNGSTVNFLRTLAPDSEWFIRMLLFCEHPIFNFQYQHQYQQLWYLLAIAICYAFLWIYIRFCGNKSVNYHPIYIIGFLFCFLHLVFEEIFTACVFELSFTIHRNAQLFGLPMFALGLFIREYQEQIIANFKLTPFKLVLIIVAGLWISVQEWKEVGNIELFSGTIVAVIALMLLMAECPTLSVKSPSTQKIICSFGPISTWIYLLHVIILAFYEKFLQLPLYEAYPSSEPWLRPFIVLAISFALAVLSVCIQSLLARLFRKIKTA